MLGLTALACWIFREILFEDRVLYERDIHLVWEAYSAAFVRSWRLGGWALWGDSMGVGQSLGGHPAAPGFFPPPWLAPLLPLSAGCPLSLVRPVLGSGVGVF